MLQIRRPLLPLAADCIAVRPAILQVLFARLSVIRNYVNIGQFDFLMFLIDFMDFLSSSVSEQGFPAAAVRVSFETSSFGQLS